MQAPPSSPAGARTRVKICGVRSPADAAVAAAHGADAVGLMFYRPSPRYVTPAEARVVLRSLPPFVCPVAVFANEAPLVIERVLGEAPVAVLQFHGEESPEECRRYRLPYLKAVRVREGVDLHAAAERYHDALGLLLDAYHPAVPGGSGETFDWELIPSDLGLPVVLAGGLTAANVARAIAQVRPYAVDVSGGVEASKGVKDAAKMAAFLREVQGVQAAQ